MSKTKLTKNSNKEDNERETNTLMRLIDNAVAMKILLFR